MMHSHAKRLPSIVAIGVCLAFGARASDDGGWKVVSTQPALVKTRSQPGTSVKEVWAQKQLAADALDVQETILATADYPRFMPYVKEARRLVNDAGPDAFYSYTRIMLPVIGGRDYVVKSIVDEWVTKAGKGTFRQRWESAPDLIPLRKSVNRIRINQGEWIVTSAGEGKSTIVYSLLVDPGGVPAFMVDMANRTGIDGTLKAVEQEAQARGKLRVIEEKRRLAEEQEVLRQRLENVRVPSLGGEKEKPAAQPAGD